VVAELRHNDARELANLAGTAFQTWEIQEEDKGVTQNMVDSGAKYDAVSKSLKDGQVHGEKIDYRARGPPHAQLWAAMSLHLVNCMDALDDGSDGCKESEKKVFYQYFQQHINAKIPQQVAKHALHFRHRKYKHASKKAREGDRQDAEGRLTFAFSHDEPGREARSLMIQVLNNAEVSKAAHLMGPAPRGPPEREAARHLALIDKGKSD
ncbi:unnamed protein product, partial [Prorocentrum cordatum]